MAAQIDVGKRCPGQFGDGVERRVQDTLFCFGNDCGGPRNGEQFHRVSAVAKKRIEVFGSRLVRIPILPETLDHAEGECIPTESENRRVRE